MAIPKLQSDGLLPSGIHSCSLDEVKSAFAWNPHRGNLYEKFLNFFWKEIRPHFPDPIYFDGSFVTDKEHPDDTDVVLDLTAAPNDRKWLGLQYLQQHQERIMDEYRVHFWVNLPGQNDFSSFFQYVGVKTARTKGLNPRHLKGILRVA